MNRTIWYASYGSNLTYRHRFLCYIAGGTPAGSTHRNPGCRDRTPPLDSRPVTLPAELYFAAYSQSWGGSPAFIRGPKKWITYGRMYLITDEQFNDVVLQENDRAVDGTRFVPPYEQLTRLDTYILSSGGLYGLLWRVGSERGSPVITFTTADNTLPIGPPSEAYVKIIATGLKETYPKMTEADISQYLLRAEGIRDKIPPDQIARWVKSAG